MVAISKEEEVQKISTSIFVTNFPDHAKAKDLWNVCKQYGQVVDAFIPDRKSKAGKRYGFVRFIRVYDVDRLVSNLCTYGWGVLNFKRERASFQRPPAVISRYMGGMWIMIGFKMEDTKAKFQSCLGATSWFSLLIQASKEFVIDERITWVYIEGIPLKLWSKKTLTDCCKIGEEIFGESKRNQGWIPDFDEQEEDNSESEDEQSVGFIKEDFDGSDVEKEGDNNVSMVPDSVKEDVNVQTE
ncbi:DIE2/ALG10 family protein [Tanacetum coccineum]